MFKNQDVHQERSDKRISKNLPNQRTWAKYEFARVEILQIYYRSFLSLAKTGSGDFANSTKFRIMLPFSRFSCLVIRLKHADLISEIYSAFC